MPSEWPRVRVADVCELVVDCVNKTAPIVPNVTPYRMIRTTNIRGGRIDLTNCKCVDEPTYQKWTRRASVQDGDILLTREAPIGEVGYAFKLGPAFLGQRVMQYRANPKKLNARFLLYAFLSPELQHQFRMHEGSGSVVSHIKVGECSEFKVPLPPLHIQEDISGLLGALDDKIALLRETNATLEAIAQTLFKSWFVDFDPVRAKAEGREPEGMPPEVADLFPCDFEDSELGAIPKGWRVGRLGDVLKLRVERTKPCSQTEHLAYVPIECITSKSVFLVESRPGIEAQSSLTLFRRGDILFGAMRPYFHKVCLAPFDGVTRTTAFVLAPAKLEMAMFALFQMFHDRTIEFATSHSEGSTIPYAKWAGSMENMGIVVPPNDVAAAFGRIVDGLMQRGIQNIEQSQSLAELRDTLLPRLMSGKLDIGKPQEGIEEAA